jgi:hypothetical protein
MDFAAMPKECFGWMAIGFSRAALSRQFELARNSPSPFFHTHVQYQMYYVTPQVLGFHLDTCIA